MKLLSTHKRKLLAFGACMIPLSGYAADASSDLSYGYVEADYINLDIDTGDEDISRSDLEDGDGFGLSASVPIGERFFIYGDYSDTEADFTFRDNLDVIVPGNTDLQRLNLGLGFRAPLSASTDLVFSGGYTDIDYDHFDLGGSSSSSLDDLDDDGSDGYTADVKLRSQLSQFLEGSLGARYTDIEDADGLSVIGNLMYEFSPNWGLNLSVDAGSDLVTWAAGVRYSF
jgi:hypothetical protein